MTGWKLTSVDDEAWLVSAGRNGSFLHTTSKNDLKSYMLNGDSFPVFLKMVALSNMNVQLREVTLEDETFLLKVYASTRDQELAGLGWDEKQKDAFIRMQYVIREKSFPRGEDRIVVLDGSSVGRLAVDHTEEAIWLRDIALLTEYRNAGIGSGLIRDLMHEAAECGRALMLHVLFISPARKLYERLGFSVTGSDAGYLEMTWLPPSSIASEE